MQSEPYVRYAIHADPHFRAESMNGHRRMMMALNRHDPVAMNALVDEHLERDALRARSPVGPGRRT